MKSTDQLHTYMMCKQALSLFDKEKPMSTPLASLSGLLPGAGPALYAGLREDGSGSDALKFGLGSAAGGLGGAAAGGYAGYRVAKPGLKHALNLLEVGSKKPIFGTPLLGVSLALSVLAAQLMGAGAAAGGALGSSATSGIMSHLKNKNN